MRPSGPGSNVCCLAVPLKPTASAQVRCSADSGSVSSEASLATVQIGISLPAGAVGDENLGGAELVALHRVIAHSAGARCWQAET